MNDAKVIKLVTDALGDSRVNNIDDFDVGKLSMNAATFQGLNKIILICSELYEKRPEVFRAKFSKMVREVKLNIKISETYPLKKDINKVYMTIKFFDERVAEQKLSYDECYRRASKAHGIPEKFIRSIVGTRNALKRNKIKL